MSKYIQKSVGGDDGKLASALLIGDRDCVPDEITFDFSRSGISHLLALSGLHVSIIIGGLGWILTKLCVKRNIRAVILAVLSLAYLALTGFSPSACRAVIMADTVWLSWIFMSQSDGVTSVSFAAMLILLISPESVASYGFWLSCVSVFGLIVFMPTIGNIIEKLLQPINYKLVKKPLSIILNGISVGLVATASVCLFTTVWFGEMSYMSAPVTLALTLPLTVLLGSSLMILTFGWIPYFSKIIGVIAQKSAEVIIKTASDVSDIDGVLMSMNYIAVTVTVIAATAILALVTFAVIKSKTVRCVLAFTPILCAVCVISAAVLSAVNDSSDRELIYVSTSSQSEQIILTHGDSGVICDMSDGSTALSKITLDVAKRNCLTEIEVLILTDCTAKHPSSLDYICNKIKVKQLWVPEPFSTDEYYYTVSVIKVAERLGLDVIVYSLDGELIVFGDSKLVFEKQYIERSARPLTKLTYKSPEGQAVWLTPAFYEYSEFTDLSDSELVMFSGSGPAVHLNYGFTLADGSTVIFNNVKTARSADGVVFEKQDKIKYILEPNVYTYDFKK